MKEKIGSIVTKSENILKSTLSWAVHIPFAFIWTLLWFPVAISMAFAESYYPEKPRKDVLIRLIDNIYWVLRYQRANIFYTLYGLDIVGGNTSNYIDEKGFWKGLDKVNYHKGVHSQVCLLRDKFLFYRYMNSMGMPVPEVFAIIKNGQVFNADLMQMPVDTLKNEKEYFIKDVDGECASFVKRIHGYNDLLGIIKDINHGTYILQRSIQQSEEMSKINPKAVNTLRIITVYNAGEPYVLSALLRVGTENSGNVDNWAAGGLAIGIEETGHLKQYGLYKPGRGTKDSVHPDTGVVFSEFEIPSLKEAFDIACAAHRCFYGIGAIGWDIAITPDGPCFIEGNDNFEITLMQACDRPLKAAWLNAVK